MKFLINRKPPYLLGNLKTIVEITGIGVIFNTIGDIDKINHRNIRLINISHGFIFHGLSFFRFGEATSVFSINGLTKEDLDKTFINIQKIRSEQIKDIIKTEVERIQSIFHKKLNVDHYFDANKSDDLFNQIIPFKENIPGDYHNMPFDNELKISIRDTLAFCEKKLFNKYIKQRNDLYIQNELTKWRSFFDKIERFPLTQQQCEAILYDEINNLIIAGAGTGKTSTLMGKVGYILEKLLAQPDEILVLAFTDKAAQEIAARIKNKFQKDINVRTFHSLGKHIIQSQGKSPSVSKMANDEKAIHDFILECFIDLMGDDNISSLITKYMLFYLVPYRSKFSFESEGQYINYIKNYDLRSLKGEKVKSNEERLIANFLFQNQINYEYEAKYKFETTTKEFKQYKPDFYLTDYDIYIEHFGVNRENNPPNYVDKIKYLEGMNWKREIHKKNKTNIIETFSYEFDDGSIFNKLSVELEKHHITLKPLREKDLFDKLKEEGYTNQLIMLLSRFLVLYKSMQIKIKDLYNKSQVNVDKMRFYAFIKLFDKILHLYQEHLSNSNEIDFNDMINDATNLIKEGKYISPFKYILVDEFQDISYSRFCLLYELKNQRKDCKLICVGDDWQSIFRFAGADLSIMTSFEKYFGYTKKSILQHTFRFGQPILDLSTDFILSNPNQIKKKLLSEDTGIDKPVKMHFVSKGSIFKVLQSILNEINNEVKSDKAKVMLLGRYKLDKPNPEYFKSIKKAFPNLSIEFMTVHKAKGSEADYVIIVNLRSGKYGFPCEIADDPILNLVMIDSDDYPNAEERRLFYVALTRAKRRVYMIVDISEPSSFATELANSAANLPINYSEMEYKPVFCPNCKSGSMIIKNGEFGQFVGCSNYPYCEEKGIICSKCGEIMFREMDLLKFVCSSANCQNTIPICPKCGNQLVIRRSKHGEFWGCASFSRDGCDHTQNI